MSEIKLTLEQNLEVYTDIKSGNKLRAVKKVKDWTGGGLKECKEYCDFIFDRFDEMSLKRAKILGDSLEKITTGIAQQIIGFSLREIPEPSGYMAVFYKGSISQLVAYYTISNPELIMHKENDIYYCGLYFRFKKDIEIDCEEIIKL